MFQLKSKIKNFLCKAQTIESNYQYKALTPIDSAENGEYSNALLQALKNNNIKNIAVTGPYGSGKSSVLKTFIKNFEGRFGFQFLNISLATFNNISLISDPKEEFERKIQVNNSIEKSLLQQILFKVKAYQLEESNFTRINIKTIWTNSGIALLLMSSILVTFFIFKPTHPLFKDSTLFVEKYLWVFQSFVFFVTVCLLQHVLNILPKIRLSKLGIASAEISFNENKGDSVLNKYLDELIYFFSATKYNVVIIEDLDRFGSIEIFTNLRELNFLLNNSEEIISRNKHIKFIYALGDDVFESIDRAKFFDFIIPIIPVVNSSNAAEKLRCEINAAFKKNTIPNEFFDEITWYIDDMRLLLNITNEFVMYKTKLDEISKIKLKDEKLLAMIIYKNKYPNDFVKLNFRKGIVADAFNKKNHYQTLHLKNLNEKINEFRTELKSIEDEKVTSIKELQRIYLSKYFELIDCTAIRIQYGAYLSFSQILSGNHFDNLRALSSFNYVSQQNNNSQNISIKFSEIENAIDKNVSYSRKLELVENKLNHKAESLQIEIDELLIKLDEVAGMKLKDLMINFPDEKFIEAKSITDSDLKLIKFLIAEGYLDENYESYTSFFYEGDVSKADQQFLISLTSHEPLDYEYKLYDVKKITKKLKTERYSNRSILNFDLFEYLLENEKESINSKNAFKLLTNIKSEGYVFVYQFLLNKNQKGLFIEKIFNLDKNYWSDFVKSDFLEQHDIKIFLVKFLTNISIKSLTAINVNGYITNLLSCRELGIQVFEFLDIKKSEEIILAQNIKFDELTKWSSKQLLDIIDFNNAYVINKINLKIILNNSESISSTPEFPSYTAITRSNKKHLIAYIGNNINEYVKNVLLDPATDPEEEACVISLLNHEDLTHDNAENIIKTLLFSINNINSINDMDLWGFLFASSKVEPTWNNVKVYFKESENTLTEELISFFNNSDNYNKLSKEKLNDAEELTSEISQAIVMSDQISDDSYRELLNSLPYTFKGVENYEISSIKKKLLLDTNKINCNEDNYKFLADQFSEESYKLIERNAISYFQELFDLEVGDYKKLIQSSLSKELKMKLIGQVPNTLIKNDLELAKLLCKFAIENGLPRSFSLEVFDSMMEHELDIETKLILINSHFTDLDISKVKHVISKLDPLKQLLSGIPVTYDKTQPLIDFVKLLKNSGYVKSVNNKQTIRITPLKVLYQSGELSAN